MADDAAYLAFLEKANEPLTGYAGAAAPADPARVALRTVDEGAEVPGVIRGVVQREEVVYVSDADEPFEGVSLKLEKGGLPDEEQFALLVAHPTPFAAHVEIMDVSEWDRTGQYKEVVDAVREACKGGDVRVYRVPRGGTRVEYWVVGVDREEGRLVGVKALGIES